MAHRLVFSKETQQLVGADDHDHALALLSECEPVRSETNDYGKIAVYFSTQESVDKAIELITLIKEKAVQGHVQDGKQPAQKKTHGLVHDADHLDKKRIWLSLDTMRLLGIDGHAHAQGKEFINALDEDFEGRRADDQGQHWGEGARVCVDGCVCASARYDVVEVWVVYKCPHTLPRPLRP
jgi:hypothetical protein